MAAVSLSICKPSRTPLDEPQRMPKTERPSRFRLSPDIRPCEYDIHLEPDLEAGRFRGEVRIAVALERARQEVVLHAAELKVQRAAASLDGDEVAARVRADAADQTVTLRFPRARSRPTAIRTSPRKRPASRSGSRWMSYSRGRTSGGRRKREGRSVFGMGLRLV